MTTMMMTAMHDGDHDDNDHDDEDDDDPNANSPVIPSGFNRLMLTLLLRI